MGTLKFKRGAGAPSASAEVTEHYYDSTNKLWYYHDGTNWIATNRLVATTLTTFDAALHPAGLFFLVKPVSGAELLYVSDGTAWLFIGTVGDSAPDYVSISGGTSTAYTLLLNRTFANYYDGMRVMFRLHTNCGIAATVNVNGKGAIPLYINGIATLADALATGVVFEAIYENGVFNIISAGNRIVGLNEKEYIAALQFTDDALAATSVKNDYGTLTPARGDVGVYEITGFTFAGTVGILQSNVMQIVDISNGSVKYLTAVKVSATKIGFTVFSDLGLTTPVDIIDGGYMFHLVEIF